MSPMYAGFQQAAPEMDVGFDLATEYEAARQLFKGHETYARSGKK